MICVISVYYNSQILMLKLFVSRKLGNFLVLLQIHGIKVNENNLEIYKQSLEKCQIKPNQNKNKSKAITAKLNWLTSSQKVRNS